MVEALSVNRGGTKSPKGKGKKGGKCKGGKKGMSEEQAEAQFMIDMEKAMQESKVSAGLVAPLEDYVADAPN